jgi:hypothetical protein
MHSCWCWVFRDQWDQTPLIRHNIDESIESDPIDLCDAIQRVAIAEKAEAVLGINVL